MSNISTATRFVSGTNRDWNIRGFVRVLGFILWGHKPLRFEAFCATITFGILGTFFGGLCFELLKGIGVPNHDDWLLSLSGGAVLIAFGLLHYVAYPEGRHGPLFAVGGFCIFLGWWPSVALRKWNELFSWSSWWILFALGAYLIYRAIASSDAYHWSIGDPRPE